MDSAGDSEPGWLAATEERSGSWVTGVGFTVGLAMASIGFYIASIGVVVVLLAPELGLSVGQLAWVGSLFGYGLLVMAVTGPVLLRLGANRVVALGAASLGLGSLLLALPLGAAAVYSGAILQGLGAAALILVVPKLLHGPGAEKGLTRANAAASPTPSAFPELPPDLSLSHVS